MPYVTSDGAKIYWREEGTGEPLVLIMGLGCSSDLWHRTAPELSLKYRTILFDNRGVGRSDVPPGPYSISTMAGDVAAVLDAAGVESAHVFGYSMGGMIAQELALQHPLRMRSLILGGTNCGGGHAVLAAPEVLNTLMARVVDPVEAFWAMAPYLYDASTPRAKLEEDLEARGPTFPTLEGYLAQLQAVMGWESHDRLNSLKVPTLVIHGETDQLIPAQNAEILAKEIPGAKLIKIAGAGHILLTDKSQAANEAILSFLNDVS
ncbi:MAG TPA: alpha/beta fold hydrolase [Pyrinomonadaceae bacterium]|jgi:pimeloyl-ACP methyl ester carboxylesterase|nr:alpha/beta fold hydrolase [Pyrinomonadaceae bacterium]